MTKLDELISSAMNALRQIERQLKAPNITDDLQLQEALQIIRGIELEARVDFTIYPDNTVQFSIWAPGSHRPCKGQTLSAAVASFREEYRSIEPAKQLAEASNAIQQLTARF